MASRNAGSGRRVRRFPHLGVQVEQLEDPLRGGDRLLQIGVDAAQLLDRPVHQQQRGDERRELAGGEPVHRNLAAAVPQRAGNRDPAEKLHQRRQHREHAGDLEIGAIELARGALELRRFARLRRRTP